MSTTPNLGLQLPIIGGSDGVWGSILNNDLTVIDSLGLVTISHPAVSGSTVPGTPVETAEICIAGGITRTLPDANANDSRLFTYVNITSAPITIATQPGQTINGNPTWTLTGAYEYVRLVASGGNYLIVGKSVAGGSGTVTSVALVAPAEFTVSGSPVTAAGTLTLTKASESANTVWAAPSGTAGMPTFRALLAADIPNIAESQVTNLVSDLAAKAPLASPALTGSPSAPTQTTGDNSTKLATTAYVSSQITASAPALAPVQSVAGKTGMVMLVEGDIANLVADLAAKAPTARLINTTAPLTGGGDLTADRTLAVSTMTGDSGSGGAKGVVPAPGSGDAAAGKYLKADGTWAVPPGGGGGSGTVTSVGLTAPAEFTVTGSPITTSGTLALAKANEAANTVWAGPTTGAAAAPTFRALVAGDIPATLNATTINGSLFLNYPGTAQQWKVTTFTDNKFYITDVTNSLDPIVVQPISGNVGIGNETPPSKLSVGGTFDASGIAALNGGATTTTPTAGDNSTNVATTAFVQTALTTGAYRLNRILMITATGTYTPTTGTRALYVECVGGGGGGGGAPVTSSNAAAGSGGGGGSYSTVWLTGTIKASYSVVIGAGGTAPSGANGGNGQNTTFDSPSVCTGVGGGGGSVGVAGTVGVIRGSGGGAGSAGVGDMRASGASGQPGLVLSATVAVSGNGGSPAAFGSGALGLVAQGAGTAAGPYGSGGAGGVSINGAAVTGGTGGAGVIRVWEFF